MTNAWGIYFPRGNFLTPKHLTCTDCSGDGWGPMLHDHVWFNIEKIKLGVLLCQECMEKRLGRPLNSSDLRDCPMNSYHPLYKGSYR